MLVTTVSIAVCYGCAVMSFKFIERPSNQFLRKYFLKPRSVPARAEQMQAATAP